MITIDLTFEKLEGTVRDYFKDYFDKIGFAVHENEPLLSFLAQRGDIAFSHVFPLVEWDRYFKLGLQFHHLENLRGEIVREEKQILLEHQKAAN